MGRERHTAPDGVIVPEASMDVDPPQLRQAADQVEAALGGSGADGLSLDLSGDVGDDTLASLVTSG